MKANIRTKMAGLILAAAMAAGSISSGCMSSVCAQAAAETSATAPDTDPITKDVVNRNQQ